MQGSHSVFIPDVVYSRIYCFAAQPDPERIEFKAEGIKLQKETKGKKNEI